MYNNKMRRNLETCIPMLKRKSARASDTDRLKIATLFVTFFKPYL